MEWSVLKKPKLWGDYGDVLISGYYNLDNDGAVHLHRAGPFLPPLSIPWSSVGGPRVIVSDEFRMALIEANFTELEFRPVIKQRIIRLDWHLWDRTADVPAENPDEGEPENYIWDRPHDESAAAGMQDAWELLVPVSSVTYERDAGNGGPLVAVMENREYPRWFRSLTKWGDDVVSPFVRDWLESCIPEWIRFEPWRYRIA